MEEVSRSKLGLGGGGRVVDARMKVVKKKDETSSETKNKGRGRSEVFANKEGGLVAREKVGGAYPAGVDLPDEAAVGRLGSAFVATGKGGGAARNTTMTATTGKTKMGNFEWEPNGSFNVMKGRARVSPTAETISPDDEGYYSHSYGQLAIHKEMLQDEVRTGTYLKAIMRNKHLFRGKVNIERRKDDLEALPQVVLDVGCGTGVLSIFAAKAGAAKVADRLVFSHKEPCQVIGVDMSSVARHAAEVIKKNGYEEHVSIVRGRVEEVKIGVEKVDIIVSEWMGYCLLYESMLPSVLFARDKYLAEDGLLLPSSCSLYIGGMSDIAWHNLKFGFWDNVEGYKMHAMKALAITEPTVDLVNPVSMMTEPFLVKKLNLHTCTKDDLEFNTHFNLKATRNGNLTALVAFFNVSFDDGHKGIVLSTSPWAPPTHWKQTIFHLKNNVRVSEGQLIGGSFDVKSNSRNERDLDLTVRVQREEEEGVVTECSLFKLR